MAADTEPLEILLHLPLLCEDKVRKLPLFANADLPPKTQKSYIILSHLHGRTSPTCLCPQKLHLDVPVVSLAP